jgi:hypothetical protein
MGNHAIVRDEAWDLIDRWQRFLCSDGHCLLRLAGKFEALRQHRQPRDRGSWRHRTLEPDLVASALTLTQRQPLRRRRLSTDTYQPLRDFESLLILSILGQSLTC